MKRTANEIAKLFTENRNFKWMFEPASNIVNYNRETTSMLLTAKQWNWLLNIYRQETKQYNSDSASGQFEDGTNWYASFTGYYTKDRNGSAKLTLSKKVE